MTTQTIVDGVTLSAASWANDVDTATYSALTSVAGTNTITAAGPANLTSAAGVMLRFIPAATNTGATTINITPSGGAALGAKNIFWNGAACLGGEIRINVPCIIIYDGTQFNVLPSGSVPLPVQGTALVNGYLDWTIAANALTIAVKTWAGSDPTTSNPVFYVVRSATATVGLPVMRSITAALSVVVSSGSTLGAINSTAFLLWAVLFNDAGTDRLGVINTVLTATTNPGIYPLAGWGIASSTTEGGAGGADSAHVFYTGTGVTSVGFTTIGYATWESGLATVGTWGTAATRQQLFGPGVALPGQRIKAVTLTGGGGSSTSSTSPVDVTSATISITPNSAANMIRCHTTQAAAATSVGATNTGITNTLTNASNTVLGANSIAGSAVSGGGGNGWSGGMSTSYAHIANSGSSLTYKLRHFATNGAETATTSGINMFAEEIAT